MAAGGGASANTDRIDYVDTASLSNATDFGDVIQAQVEGLSGAANATRATFTGGINSGSRSNNIQYVTISTPGDATDAADLTAGIRSPVGFSGT